MAGIRDTWKGYNNGDLLPSQLIHETFFRLKYLQPGYGFFVSSCDSVATQYAELADADWRPSQLQFRNVVDWSNDDIHPAKRFAGLTFHIKDQHFYHTGVAEVEGSLTKVNMAHDQFIFTRAKGTERWVRKLIDEGGIFLGTTATFEYGVDHETNILLNGAIRNPHDYSKIVGGSSGGAACATAVGIGHIGLGTDKAGSIRTSASLCGVVGVKPRKDTALSVQHTATPGLFARSVADCAIAFDAIHGSDIFSDSLNPIMPHDLHLGVSHTVKPRIAVLGRLPYVFQHDVVTCVFNRAIETLQQNAAFTSLFSMVHVSDLGFGASEDAHPTKAMQDLWPVSVKLKCDAVKSPICSKPYRNDFDPYRMFVVDNWTVLPADEKMLRYERADKVKADVTASIQKWFDKNDFDFLITPTIAEIPSDLDTDLNEFKKLDSKVFTDFTWNPYTYLFNWTNQSALSLPCGFTTDINPLPIGMQLVVRRPQEDSPSLQDLQDLLFTAHAIEKALDIPYYYSPSFPHLRYGGLRTCYSEPKQL